MINDEFEIKINEIIKYLKRNRGYNYKLYNHTCSIFNNQPDSNIVEYAEDIKNYWLSINNKKTLYDKIILDIIKTIYDNIKLFSLDDSKLTKIKKYCKDNFNEDIKHIDYELLKQFTNETLTDLLSAEYLYDFRNI